MLPGNTEPRNILIEFCGSLFAKQITLAQIKERMRQIFRAPRDAADQNSAGCYLAGVR